MAAVETGLVQRQIAILYLLRDQCLAGCAYEGINAKRQGQQDTQRTGNGWADNGRTDNGRTDNRISRIGPLSRCLASAVLLATPPTVKLAATPAAVRVAMPAAAQAATPTVPLYVILAVIAQLPTAARLPAAVCPARSRLGNGALGGGHGIVVQ